MSGRTSIDRDSIIAAALELIREGGWESVSARSLAARLGSSTMPIYSAVGSMEELKRAAFAAAGRMLLQAQRVRRSGSEALDLALGYVLFARDEPRIFAFFLANQKDIGQALLAAARDPDSPGSLAGIGELEEVLGPSMPREGGDDLVMNSWIYTNGLAVLVAGGALVLDEAEIARRLEAAGGAFYLFERNKSGPAR